MNFRNISAWSIRNPVIPIVLFTGLLLAGIMAFMGMKVQDSPDIEFPMVIVVISQPGAAPTEIETQITQKIEAAIQNVEGVENINSTASEGSSQSQVEFEIGTDIAQAVNEVKAAVDQTRGELPDGILEPRIFRAQTSSEPIGYFAVAGPDMTLEQLSYFIDDTISKRLKGIEGVAEIGRGGGVSREILVILDPARMQALGVTASQLNAQLRQINTDAAGGVAEIAGSRQSVRVLGNADTAYQLSQLQIPIGGGRTVQLDDFATVRDSYGEITSLGKIDGRQVVNFSLTRARGASDVAVYDATLKELKKIEKEHPGVSITPLFTSVEYTRAQYESSIAAMVEGALLAVVVVFFFLRDWRATMIAALAIPLSAIPTFWFMDLMGFTLNSLSLLALGLVAGVLVDDAIVEIENIVRHMRMGKSAYQASIDAADEIGLAVVATPFSIVAVFLPVGLMPGVSGQFFKNFGLTVVASVLMSLAVARMITPMVAAYFLKAKGHASHGEGPLMDRYMGLLRWTLDRSGMDEVREEIGRPETRWWYLPLMLLFGIFLIVLPAAAFFGSFGFLQSLKLPDTISAAVCDDPTNIAALAVKSIVTLALLVVGMVAAYFGLRAAIWLWRLLSRLFGAGYRHWHSYREARLRDHRVWMLGTGFGAMLLTVGAFMSLPAQFFPEVNSDSAACASKCSPARPSSKPTRSPTVSPRSSRIVPRSRPRCSA